jgi:pimeloyl-ACP methyl ester carboxylesterase
VLALEPHYRILTFDYPAGCPTNDSLADAIVQLIRSEKLQNVYLVGQSYGGLLAQCIAKHHPDLVSGLILSNTGTITPDMSPGARKIMDAKKTNLKKAMTLVKWLPFGIIRRLMVKKVLKKINQGNIREAQYIKSFFTFMFQQLDRKKELHMCALMIEFMETQSFLPSDFAYLDGKVLLLLSSDDDTFGAEIPDMLINLMPNPRVQRSISGGHLAILLKFDTYIDEIRSFVRDS